MEAYLKKEKIIGATFSSEITMHYILFQIYYITLQEYIAK